MIVYPTDTGPAIDWHTAEWENRSHLVASESTTGAYVIEHVASGSVYVGGSMNIPQRWRIHIKQLRAGKHYNKPLQADWTHYGAAAFVFRLVEQIPWHPQVYFELARLERTWLAKVSEAATETRKVYNMTRYHYLDTGAVRNGRPRTPRQEAE